MSAPRRPGVIVDLDGTLLDSVYLQVQAWAKALRDTCYDDVAMQEVHRVCGLSADSLVKELTGATDQRVLDAYDEAYEGVWKDVWPFADAAELLRHCAKLGFDVVVTTHASAAAWRRARALLDADDAITGHICAEQLDLLDQEPNLVQTAVDTYQLDVDQSLAIGDTAWDMRAAVEANLRCVGLLCGGNSEQTLREAGACDVYDDASDLLGHLLSPHTDRIHLATWRALRTPPQTA